SMMVEQPRTPCAEPGRQRTTTPSRAGSQWVPAAGGAGVRTLAHCPASGELDSVHHAGEMPTGHDDRNMRAPCCFQTAVGSGPAAVSEVRHGLTALLSQWRVTTDLCEAAELVASELVTNALRHGRNSAVGFAVVWSDGRLILMVSDQVRELP